VQIIAWCMVFVLSVLIVASRKHYTVDVLIAWYVVPLVFYAMLRRWTTKRPVNEEPWPHRSLAEDNALQLEEVVVHGTMAAPEVRHCNAVFVLHPAVANVVTLVVANVVTFVLHLCAASSVCCCHFTNILPETKAVYM